MEVAQSAVVPVKSRPSVPRCSAGTEELSANLDGPMYGAASNIVEPVRNPNYFRQSVVSFSARKRL